MIYDLVGMTHGDEAQARELVWTLKAGFGAVDTDCTDSAVSMAANALTNRDAPIAPQASEFIRGEFLRIAQVAEGLMKWIKGETKPAG
ncbi:hypothetical protein TSH7_16820 [Azospirillum sp. TSH7]|uniref:hypothetical protein n=1 Tax=unclassified Azospirillum TaxID=2630922 RepID=UPI000D608F50|nr:MULTISPECIES: hypothetical protein [unclassified Azospirillum]PWC58082.1 hypothetical protein TSH20_29990 [Azospirillum sp. TSH20]PWC61477.1 hypothetical protein TSH7_16820 [Azospirillum sp. TSH7]QCG96326.1 hypothetical protein E6C67_21180 [Azospirillum sp. TSA2s]